MTVHNLAFQGQLPGRDLLPELGLPPESLRRSTASNITATISFLKAGLALCRPDHHRVADLCRGNPHAASAAWASTACCAPAPIVLTGILNGIDTPIWNPATDALIADALRAGRRWRRGPRTRRRCRPHGPRAGRGGAVVRRGQPPDLAEGHRPAARGCLPALLARGRATGAARRRRAGDRSARFRTRPRTIPGRIGCVIGYDEALAHLLQAGADALLVPSRFEPCGLTQLCALRYGAVPVVARVGGLADTVIDANADGAGRRRRDRRAVRAGHRRRARRRDPARRGAVSRAGDLARPAGATAWRPTCPGAPSAAPLRRAVPRTDG